MVRQGRYGYCACLGLESSAVVGRVTAIKFRGVLCVSESTVMQLLCQHSKVTNRYTSSTEFSSTVMRAIPGSPRSCRAPQSCTRDSALGAPTIGNASLDSGCAAGANSSTSHPFHTEAQHPLQRIRLVTRMIKRKRSFATHLGEGFAPTGIWMMMAISTEASYAYFTRHCSWSSRTETLGAEKGRQDLVLETKYT